MQAVCELMPAAIPSLALCLQTLISFDEPIIFSKAKELTKCNYDGSKSGFLLNTIDSNRSISYDCKFPGSDMYDWLLNLKLNIVYFEKVNEKHKSILNDFNLKNKFFHIYLYEKSIKFYNSYKEIFKKFIATGEVLFDKYFYGDLYTEFSSVYINSYLEQIENRLSVLSKVEVPEHAPVRPFDKISQSMV